MVSSEEWNILFLSDYEGASLQHLSNNCGVFMLMYALYATLQKPFDFNEADMTIIRRWWCAQVLQKFTVESNTEGPEVTPAATERDQDQDQSYLPPEILQKIIGITLRMDMTMLESFNNTSKLFRDLSRPFHPMISINDSVAKDLEIESDPVHISIGKICKVAGCGSGLVLRLAHLFSSQKNWMKACLVLRHTGYGRYLVEDVQFAE
ncbi:hypothetical protein R3I93_001209 [Phoxinus phoxinus]|uniref:Uncharacterized protein n=1 Tax=Phoxinus phoxinus TaxID=58324 RepID=A0AAN9DPE0_9TELE